MQALDKAREAARKERILCKQREQAQLADQINLDLTYCVSNHVCMEAFIYYIHIHVHVHMYITSYNHSL